MVTDGIEVYPDPGLTNNISFIEQTPPLHVVIATADAEVPHAWKGAKPSLF